MARKLDGSVVDYTINAIRNRIRDQTFAPGQRLIVSDVTRILGVSAGPVREAIRRLSGEGLIEIIPNRGAIVRTFGPDEIREIYEVREALEARAAGLAAERINLGDNRSKLIEILQEGEISAAGDGIDYIHHNAQFHELIYELANNHRLKELASGLSLPIYKLQYHQMMNRSSIKTSLEEHHTIAEAILSGSPDRAEKAMRQHVRSSGRSLTRAVNHMDATENT